MCIVIEDVSQTLIKTHKVLPVYIFLITYYKRVQNMSLYQYHTCYCPSVQCPVSVLSHSVESCGTCLRRPGIVFHNMTEYFLFKTLICIPNHMSFGITLTQCYISFSGKGYQIEIILVAINFKSF